MGSVSASTPLGIRISIDRGGTFTDVHASIPDRPDIILKLLSVDPANYQDAPTEGIRRILELCTGIPHPRGQLLDLFHIESIRMGTTVATNALLERKGARSALLITRGFKDLLFIGNQSRPDIFDLTVARPEVLYEQVVEVDERVTMEDYTEDPKSVKTPVSSSSDPSSSSELVTAITEETIRVIQRPDLNAVKASLQSLWEQGFRSVAVVFIHSYAYPEHELQVGRLATEMGFSVTLSAAVQPMINMVPRGMSAMADAYLTPVIKDYISSIESNFAGGFSSEGTRIEFMQSDGGLVDYRKFSGLKAILSGPAGGVVGYAQTSWDTDEKKPVIGFDMGGTSTDVSRYAGVYDHVFETTTAGIGIQSPQLDIHTVAAGGGSILTWKNGLFNVGPESASAHPGPACYRKGGPLTVTDANLFLGRLLPEYFPKVFGPRENEPLNREVTAEKFAALTNDINADRKQSGLSPFSAEQVAMGFLEVANEGMARPIRALTEARGYETSAHHLACFGGAGGQHACSVATVLGISRIIIHKYSSILSAYGMSLADVVHEVQKPAAITYTSDTAPSIHQQLADLAAQASTELKSQGFAEDRISHDYYLNMRYTGSSSSLMVLKGDEGWDFKAEFEAAHRREFGFHFPDKAIIVDDVRVRATGAARTKVEQSPYAQLKQCEDLASSKTPAAQGSNKVYFAESNWVDTPTYELQSLAAGSQIAGPALILDKTQTIVVTPNTTATILDSYVVIDRQGGTSTTSSTEFSPIQLSIFGHRFMSIAEQMGRTLQKTSVSTNIKERLDFSCAIFSPDGGLVANAPHVPVHLGSMQFAVRYQHELWAGKLKDGDVLVSNHPSCGGTHLPDITVITPVFDADGSLAFYVASRGHHADIGGILPGSMPPNSAALWQEGAAIESTRLVSGGVFNEAEITRLLLDEPAKYDGCSGTRKLADNISDLKAQIAANQKGITLIRSLIAEFGLAVVHRYMYAIQRTAEIAVRELLKRTLATHGTTLSATDYMDDGTPITLNITLRADGSATFDFTGTGPQVLGNTNAPLAITHSAIIYCLRSLVNSSIPLNQGCLNPIDIVVPPNTILNPAKGLGVVGGNVLTSQRVTDVVLRAFRACAASQGCCNNLTFGTGGKDPVTGAHVEGFGCYETIAGGAGAGPGWKGASGVHVHMTNTRITDPEVFEKRYPCILRKFGLRSGSAGKGQWDGGEGTVREIEFRVPVMCSILSERRSRQPFGMEGGGDGGMGRNLIVRKKKTTSGDQEEEEVVSLGAKASVKLGQGERVIIMSPGGGAWGALFEHPNGNNRQNQNSFGALSNNNNNTARGPFGKPAAAASESASYYLDRDAIVKDLTEELPSWIMSAYGPGRDAPEQLWGGPIEQSFEEMRLHFTMGAEAGNPQGALNDIQQLNMQAQQKIQTAKSNPDAAINYILDAAKNHPNRHDLCRNDPSRGTGEFAVGKRSIGGTSGQLPNAFSQSVSGGNPFSQSSNQGQQANPFGGGGGGTSAFGQPSAMGQQPSAFGQPSAMGQTSALGSSGFGQTSALGQKPNPFGQSTTSLGAGPSAGSGFGQTSALGQKPNPFGSSLGSSSSAFGQPSQLGAATPNPFGASTSASSVSPFGTTTNTTTASPFGALSGSSGPSASAGFLSGQPTASNPFGQAQAQAQPPQTAEVSMDGAPTPTAGVFGAAGGNPAAGAPTTSVFGQPAANPFGASTQSTNPFGASTGQPAGGAAPANPFGSSLSGPSMANTAAAAPAQPGKFANPYGPNSSRQHPPLQSYATKAPTGQLQTWKGKPVVYKEIDSVPTPGTQEQSVGVFGGGGAAAGSWTKIWFPDGPPMYYKDTEPLREYTDVEKATWERFMATGRFELASAGGATGTGMGMPEAPPMREFVQWDF
ncbi:Hydantoinase B/oxoprolinase-domain-containing protein [Coniella lustricola]|uniref:Hydantoinase B/oxoprolinase-domain-containing protein n=1 Tax=Coniella lustricola TaxID=2025994 RepID=A0A2T3A090_9PEZI|nr:Hydantoinase B/oxoprolinase-domain-containing protein [Coniella lustricola]